MLKILSIMAVTTFAIAATPTVTFAQANNGDMGGGGMSGRSSSNGDMGSGSMMTKKHMVHHHTMHHSMKKPMTSGGM